jgi:hypothetical protein
MRRPVQGKLQDFRHVKVARQVIVLLAESAHFDAAAGTAVAGIDHRLAHAHQLLDDEVAVKDRRLAETGPNDAPCPLDKGVGVLLADLDRGAGLEEAHLLDDVQEQVSQLVDGVGAVFPHAAQVDLGEIGVGRAFGRRDADLGRRGLVVELDPQALQQLFGRLAAQ